MKQPPQASRSTGTTAKPFLAFFLILLKAVSNLSSILLSISFALSRRFSSSCFVSEITSSNSFFFNTRSSFLSTMRFLAFSNSSLRMPDKLMASLILFSLNSISNVWNSISLARFSYSRLLRTLSCCSLYLVMRDLDISMSLFLPVMDASI